MQTRPSEDDGLKNRPTPDPLIRAFLCSSCYRAVVVAMIAVGMVQVAVHQVIHMIAVGNLLVATGRAVAMILLMPSAFVLRRASREVGRRDLQDVVIHVVAMNVMEVAIVQVIRVAVVLDGNVAAPWSVLVSMARMHLAVLLFHVRTPLCGNLVYLFAVLSSRNYLTMS